jgi:hypothetical protein
MRPTRATRLPPRAQATSWRAKSCEAATEKFAPSDRVEDSTGCATEVASTSVSSARPSARPSAPPSPTNERRAIQRWCWDQRRRSARPRTGRRRER